MAGFVSPHELLTALSSTTFMQIFDDDNTGNVNAVLASEAVVQVLARAHVDVTSYLFEVYKTLPAELPSANISVLLKSAEIDYAVAYSFERHPEYVRSFGEQKRLERRLRAEKLMERIVEGIQRIATNDHPPTPIPINVGGLVYDKGQRTILDNADGTPNGGDFA